MKLKYKFSIFNAGSKVFLVLILWFLLPFVVGKVMYASIHDELLEKKERFLKHLDTQEVNDFLAAKDTDEVYGNFSALHNEFIRLYAVRSSTGPGTDHFFIGRRTIDNETANYKILLHNFRYGNIDYALEIGSGIDEIDRMRLMLRTYLLITSLVVAFLSFLIDTVYIGRILKPFYIIIESKLRAGKIPGKFNSEPVVTGTSEFRELDASLNEMMYRINAVFKRTKQYVGNVSHELLTPIALLKNRFENLIQNGSLDGDAVDKIADSMQILDMLKQIINNLLFLSKIESEHFIQNEKVGIYEIVKSSIESLEDWSASRNLSVVNDMTHHRVFTGNFYLLQTMVNNFLTNAIKYNRDNGSILFTDEVVGDRYRLTISDTGIGMDKDQQKNIFDRFARVDFTVEGYGLGLAIAQSIADFHKIGIEIASESGKGSAFTLIFPMQ